jgi:hypothetical protein
MTEVNQVAVGTLFRLVASLLQHRNGRLDFFWGNAGHENSHEDLFHHIG